MDRKPVRPMQLYIMRAVTAEQIAPDDDILASAIFDRGIAGHVAEH